MLAIVTSGGGNAQINLHFATPLAKMGTIDVEPMHHTFNIENARLVAPGHPERSVLLYRRATRGPLNVAGGQPTEPRPPSHARRGPVTCPPLRRRGPETGRGGQDLGNVRCTASINLKDTPRPRMQPSRLDASVCRGPES